MNTNDQPATPSADEESATITLHIKCDPNLTNDDSDELVVHVLPEGRVMLEIYQGPGLGTNYVMTVLESVAAMQLKEMLRPFARLEGAIAAGESAQRELCESRATVAKLERELAALVKEREELKLTIETAEGRMMVHPADNRTLLDLVSAHLVAEDKLRGELFTAEAHIGVLREALTRISNLYFGEATAIAKDALASQSDLPLIEEVREAVNYAIEGLERFHSDVLIWKHESVNILTPAPNHVHIHQRLRQLLTRLNPAKL